MWRTINGKKTYTVGLGCVGLGVVLVYSMEGHRSDGVEMIALGLGLLGLRHGVEKAEGLAAAATRIPAALLRGRTGPVAEDSDEVTRRTKE